MTSQLKLRYAGAVKAVLLENNMAMELHEHKLKCKKKKLCTQATCPTNAQLREQYEKWKASTTPARRRRTAMA